jgi:hypothetical protein
MKKTFAIRSLQRTVCLAVCLAAVITTCSCGSKADVQNAPAQKNGGGTIAVGIPAGLLPDENIPEDMPSSADLAEAWKDAATGSETAADLGASSLNAAKDAAAADADEVIEIGEKMFVGQINDIYSNPEDYLGKTIRYEGLYTYFENNYDDTRYDCVIRYGPGCCGNDGDVGLEIAWEGDMPEENDWVEVTGVVESYKENGWQYLRVRAASLNVLPVRGNEKVS